MKWKPNPDPTLFMTVRDVQELPNGTASIVQLARDEGRHVRLATVDDKGFLRSLDESRAYFRESEWAVLDEL